MPTPLGLLDEHFLRTCACRWILLLPLPVCRNICSADMARDLAPEVEHLMRSPSAHVRKKAAMCAVRIVRKCPEVQEGFVE